jgi:hypothetical protein
VVFVVGILRLQRNIFILLFSCSCHTPYPPFLPLSNYFSPIPHRWKSPVLPLGDPLVPSSSCIKFFKSCIPWTLSDFSFKTFCHINFARLAIARQNGRILEGLGNIWQNPGRQFWSFENCTKLHQTVAIKKIQIVTF